MSPKVRKVLQLLRLRQIFNGTFVKLNKASINMLRIVEPYIAWADPSSKATLWLQAAESLASFPSPGDRPDPGIEPKSPALQADSLPSELPGKPQEGAEEGEGERVLALESREGTRASRRVEEGLSSAGDQPRLIQGIRRRDS